MIHIATVMSIRFKYVSLVLLIALSYVSEAGAAQDLSLTVTPSVPEIRELDPLYLKVVLGNNRSVPLELPKPLGDRFGSIRIELRRNGEGQYRQVRTKLGGIIDGLFAPRIIAPGESASTYEVLFATGNRIIFDAPGTFELRVQIAIGGEQIVSEPVTINVVAIPTAEGRKIRESFGELRHAIGIEIPSRVDVEKLTVIESSISESELKRTLQWILGVHSVSEAQDDRQRQIALRKVRVIQEHADAITSEIIEANLPRAE